MSLKHIAFILTTVYITTTKGEAAVATLTNVTHHHPGDTVYFGPESFDNSTFTYIKCDISNTGFKRERSFTIYLESEAKKRSCNLTFKADRDDYVITDYFEVFLLNGAKSIVHHYEKHVGDVNVYRDEESVTIHKLTIVDFDDNCSTRVITLALLPPKTLRLFSRVLLVPYKDDTFDVAYRNESDTSDKYNKLRFEAEGKKLSGPVDWFAPNQASYINILPVDASSPSKGVVVIEKIEFEDYGVLRVVDHGGERILKNFSVDRNAYSCSTSNGKIGICTVFNSIYECSQLDMDGKVTLTVNKSSSDFYPVLVYNLPSNDGILVVHLARKPSSSTSADNGEDDDFYASKLGNDGKRLGTLKLGFASPREQRNFWMKVHPRGDEYCVSFASVGDGRPGYLNFAVKCLNRLLL